MSAARSRVNSTLPAPTKHRTVTRSLLTLCGLSRWIRLRAEANSNDWMRWSSSVAIRSMPISTMRCFRPVTLTAVGGVRSPKTSGTRAATQSTPSSLSSSSIA